MSIQKRIIRSNAQHDNKIKTLKNKQGKLWFYLDKVNFKALVSGLADGDKVCSIQEAQDLYDEFAQCPGVIKGCD